MKIVADNQDYYMITKLLRRFGFIGEDNLVKANAAFLRQRQSQQLSLLEPLKDNVDKKILNASIEELIKIDSETVFNSFATRCLKPQIRSLNGIADVNVQRVFQKHAHKKIPFSVKDHLKVEGMIHTCGFTDNLKPSTQTSDVVKFLQQEGCIAYVHSNVPQGLLGIESSNSLYGTSTNPHNPAFISGGSSGGQGSLVASKVSAFGVGSDSGGSARIPAAFCGTYGFKPTGSKRISLKGRVNPRGTEVKLLDTQGVKMGDVDPCFGFMTRHFNDLAWLCSKTLGKSTASYPFMYGGLWDESRFEAAKRKKLTVGYLYENHQMQLAPGIKNTIEETLALLRSENHTVVQFQFPKLHLFRDFFFEFVHQSGFLNGMIQRMNGHLTSAQAADLYDIFTFGKAGIALKKSLTKDPLVKDIYNLYLKDRTTEQFFRIHREADLLKKLFLKEWKEKGIDVLITPVMPFTAPFPGAAGLLIYQLSYSCFQNIIELPAGVIPTRLVKEEQTTYSPKNAFERMAAPSIHASKGMPLAIQVTGQHLQDEECLGAMWTINKLVGSYLQPKFNNNLK